MGVLDKIPGIGSLARKKREFQTIGAVIGAKKVNSLYEKARKNFLVLAMGLESGSIVPQVLWNCKMFVKENRKSFSPSSVEKFEALFERVNCSPNREDAEWIKTHGLNALKQAKNNDLAFFMGIPKRLNRK